MRAARVFVVPKKVPRIEERDGDDWGKKGREATIACFSFRTPLFASLARAARAWQGVGSILIILTNSRETLVVQCVNDKLIKTELIDIFESRRWERRRGKAHPVSYFTLVKIFNDFVFYRDPFFK